MGLLAGVGAIRRLAQAAGRVARAIVQRDSVMVTKHGGHIGCEREAVQALIAGEFDAACVIDDNQLALAEDGIIPTGVVRALTRTPTYGHCTMTVLEGVDRATAERFVELLLSMSFDDPAVRPLLELEGLRAWREGRTSNYDQLPAARLGFYGPDSEITGAGYGR